MLDTAVARQETRVLRIVHFVRAPIGGIFRHILDLTAEQAARGHLVGLVLDSSTGGAFEAEKIAAAAPHLALGVTRLPISRKVRLADALAAWRVYKAVRDLRPDILHGHGAKGGTLARLVGTVLSRRSRPVARFYTPHGGSLHFQRTSVSGRFYFAVERLLERFCDGIIHVSRYEADTYRDKVGAPRCNTFVVVNGLRPDEFEEIVPAPDARDILFMGMMRDLKGPDLLLRAIAAIRDRSGYTPTVAMVGAGPERDSYRRLADDLGLGEAVAFADPLPTRQGLARGRLMVVPSRAESMPYIVLESIAAGMPLVATRVGGIPEIFADAADRLVRPDDVTALADAIEQALADPAGMRTKALAARAALRERFTVAAMAEAIERIYLATLAQRCKDAKTPGLRSLQPAE